MKKFLLSSAVAALGLLALNANALPDGFESFNIRATFQYQNDFKIKKFSFGNKDLMGLVELEFPTLPFPDGSQLVTRGSFASISNQFAVLTKTGSVWIPNASSTLTDSYQLYWEANYGNRYVYNRVNDSTYNFTFMKGNLHYQDSTGTRMVYVGGVTFAKEDFQKNNESFSMPNGYGYFWLPPSAGGFDGIVNPANLSGSGKSVAIIPF